MNMKWYIYLILSLFHFTFSEREGLFEGDILLPKHYQPWDRTVIKDKSLRWPNGIIPYLLDPKYGSEERQLIREAMQEIERSTCIRFSQKKNETSYIGIYSGNGCWSNLGFEKGLQLLSLEMPDCMKKGVIMHELMHTLGFLHEHTRPDRDHYLIVHWDNIINADMKRNFIKRLPGNVDYLGQPYDYLSVMHYHAYAFSKDRLHPTLSPTRPGFTHSSLGYGQIAGKLTDTDITKLRILYECDKITENSL